MSNFKSCPFCGGKGELKRTYYKGSKKLNLPHETEGVTMGRITWVGCFSPQCVVKPRAYSLEDNEAIEAWNIRKEKP